MPYSLDDVSRHKLENGLTILVRPDNSVPIVTSMLWYRVGSSYEEPGITGVSHFIEHMLFKGTRRFKKGEIDFITARNGGYNNAFTSHDYTAYYFCFASDRWSAALEIEADRMVSTRFETHEFDMEKQVVLEELHMERDDPWEFLSRETDRAAFPSHPYGFPIIGLEEDVLGLSPERMREFYCDYYGPNNAVLVLVGDLRVDEALRLAERAFGGLERIEVPRSRNEIAVCDPAPARISLRRASNICRMIYALPAPSVRHKQIVEMHLLDHILSEGKLSRLYRRLVEKERFVAHLTTELEETFDPYLLSIRLELEEGVDPALVEAVLIDEFECLTARGIEEAELQRAQNQCTVHLLGDLETSFDQAFQLGLLEVLDRFENLNEYLERLWTVDSDSIMRAARTYCDPGRAVVSVLEADA